MASLLWNRIVIAFATIPNLRDWELTIIGLLIYGVVAMLIGIPSQFLEWNPSAKNWLRICFQSFFAPALIEEIGFRILPLPHPSENVSLAIWCLWGGVSLFLFVIYHPLNGLTFYKSGYATFRNPTFLILAALLGLVCTLIYGLTHSLWPPVLIHWISVVLWLCCLGGNDRLFAQVDMTQTD
ncbi:CPBP family glutamic-type intramembrane protease [Leptothoe spongobia]|uniref:CPBP family intramembrane metalloprotease n=1 Tax=Leptothoe spongobia TAU-MAC 1115 TaxID=1967444 RepID=A0A947GMH0_9CYAN|nr:CPBP family glutamic-type intramembrane protease [Leptothoe spongobia]MBT9317667.1 CPBP family intramembrane metalloprotease [Leptothoe spongobia TAU-MAC 1115]